MNLLFPVEGEKKDVVYTPEWVAKDMITFFQPSGRILDPCKGDGAFLKHLPPETAWCEVTEGVDFFLWNEPVDWIIGNPPYSRYFDWLYHAVTVADNIALLMPADKPFISNRMLLMLKEWGEMKHMRLYGSGSKLGFPIGFAIAAIHFQKGYKSGMTFSYAGAVAP